jgi:urease accessory protein
MKINHTVISIKTDFKTLLRWLILIVILSLPSNALAHAVAGEAGGFLTGVRHPVSGLDHVLAMIAVGIWGAQLGAPAIWLLPVIFPMVMALGGIIGLLGIPLPGMETGIAISALVLGLMIASEKRPPLWIAAVIVGFFAIFHGYAHGTELPDGQSGLLYSMGFVMATGCLHGTGISIGLIHHWPVGRFILRTAGAIIAVAGIYFLFTALK